MLSAQQLLTQAQALLSERAVREAHQKFVEATRLRADMDACIAGRWECSMLLGHFAEAWQVSGEAQGKSEQFWDGAPLDGRHVMLRCLHGYGDALQFIRYAPQLRERAASLCVETHSAMVPLLQACSGVEQVITWEPAPAVTPHWDAQIEIMEVPRIVHADPAADETVVPYLDAARLTVTRETAAVTDRLLQCKARGRVQVGFSWRSSGWNPLRSVPFSELAAALGQVHGCDLYSLQHEGDSELTVAQSIAAELPDLAMRMAQLDAVVTVDGVLAHLAGALGKPVLLLLPFAADWRWGLLDRTPWYPRFQLFRQHTPNDWSLPLAQVAAALQHLTGV